MNSHVKLGVSSTVATPAIVHSQMCLSFLFSQPIGVVFCLASGPFSQPLPHNLMPCSRFSLSLLSAYLPPTGLVDCFFNSLSEFHAV